MKHIVIVYLYCSYLAAEEKEVVKTEKKELEEIRQQLQT